MLSGQNAIKNKRSGYSTSSFGRKNKKNSLIHVNKHNITVQLSDISCHKELIIYLEIKQDKKIFNKEANLEEE